MALDTYHKWLGIPPSEQPPNHYRLLGIDLFESDSDVIDSGAQRQMAHVRTYALGPNREASQTLLNQLAAARVVLLNPTTKAQYDQSLRQQSAMKANAEDSSSGSSSDSGSSGSPVPLSFEKQAVDEPVPTTVNLPCPSCKRLLAIGADCHGAQVQCSNCGVVLLASPDGQHLHAQVEVSKTTETRPQFTATTSNRARTRNNKRRRSQRSHFLMFVCICFVSGIGVLLYSLNFLDFSVGNLASQGSRNSPLHESSSQNDAVKSGSPRTAKSGNGVHSTTPRNRFGATKNQSVPRRNVPRAPSELGEMIRDRSAATSGSDHSSGPDSGATFFEVGEEGSRIIGGTGDTASLRNPMEMQFIPIPAGEFIMGGGFETHRVTLTQAFELGIHEVTQAQFESVMGMNPSRMNAPGLPVEQVSWDQAVEFCRRLSASPEAQETGYQYRLPYEAEWEYACRAGAASSDNFGDDGSVLGDFAWFGGNANGTTHPVGTKKANAWGLFDMHGNVSEWCLDWKGNDKPDGSVVDPQGPATGQARINRGGSWLTDAGRFQTTLQSWGAPQLTEADIGFRILRILVQNMGDTKTATTTQTQSPSLPESEPVANPTSDHEPNPTASAEMEAVRQFIKNARWKEMKQQAEKLLASRMNDAQQAEAEALYELADLATYYRGGIEKAVQALNAGNDFEITDNFRVLVVEKGDNFITILFDRRTKTYSFDELPFSLAHKLASFEIPNSPRQLAAKAVYQSISPMSDATSRREALAWLAEIEESVGGEDPKRIADSLRTMFSTARISPQGAKQLGLAVPGK